jgi:aryl-alcohol dehydrogenase-like predicted oxidoreductase
MKSDEFGKTVYGKMEETDKQIIERVTALAEQRNVSQAQIALAWLLHQPGVTAPIVGATKLQQLDDAVAAVDVKLSAEELKTLEEAYIPHPVAGHS